MHIGTERSTHGKESDKESLPVDIPRAYAAPLPRFTFPGRVRASEARSPVNMQGEEGTTDRGLTPRSQGHYLRIPVLSHFSPENLVLK